ncbi:MAG: hypothetical protein NC416_11740 [Eubacterium sp.]|nr:hypothetical protein [Eubacterium sp.]
MDANKVQAGLAKEIAQNGMRLINSGKIRNHKLGNSSRIHTGEVEKRERQIYRDFLPTKNCSMVYELTGSDRYE